MNREIKFRAWYLDKMYNPAWRVDDSLYFGNGGYSAAAFHPEVKKAVLMQYTGLKDLNGKEIYEGDIVRWHAFYFDGNFDAEKEGVGNIVISPSGVYVDNRHVLFETSHDEEPCLEVIGNIYEHPELIKTES